MRSWVRGSAWLVAIGAAICTLLYLFVFDTWVIPGDDPMLAMSVEPMLRVNDRVLTRRGSTPQYGHLARCLSPDGSGKPVVGRVFGMQGDTVQIVNERVLTNNKGVATRFACGKQPMTNPATGDLVSLDCSVEDNGAATYNVLVHPEFRSGGDRSAMVGPGNVYLVSDNRHFHMDSRDYGLAELATCEHIVFRLWGDSFADSSRRFTVLW